MFELAWFVRRRLPLKETTAALLKNTADTLCHWDWSLGLCSFLYENSTDFWAAADSYAVTVDAVAAGSCRVQLRNVSAGALGEAVVLNFAVLKAVAA